VCPLFWGIPNDIEKEVAKVLNNAGFFLFRQHFQDRFEEAFAPFESKEPKHIYDYPPDVYRNANILKDINVAKKDVKAYLALCDKVGTNPKGG
jgi:Tfp pilus assembly protein PilF